MRGFLAQRIISPTEVTLLQDLKIIDNVWRNIVKNIRAFSPTIVTECLANLILSGGGVIIKDQGLSFRQL